MCFPRTELVVDVNAASAAAALTKKKNRSLELTICDNRNLKEYTAT